MRIAKTTSRKAVSKAIAKQEVEAKRASNAHLDQEQLEAVRMKAYELFVQRGCQHGYDVEDWKTAEQIVLAGVK